MRTKMPGRPNFITLESLGGTFQKTGQRGSRDLLGKSFDFTEQPIVEDGGVYEDDDPEVYLAHLCGSPASSLGGAMRHPSLKKKRG